MLRQLKLMVAPEIAHSTRSWRSWHTFPGQVLLVTLAAFIYLGVRMITKGAETAAFRNAYDLITFQSWLGLNFESWAQSAILDYRWLVTFFNWVYIWLHWPVLFGTLLLLYHFNRQRYTLMRNAMMISGALGLVFFIFFPVAPPRFFAGFTDTVTELSTSYRYLQPPSIVNKYAAMPSFHVGWNVLAGIVIFRSTKSIPIRTLAVASPLLMSAAVVLTGNHWVIDGFAGTALVMIGLFLAHRFGRLTRRWKDNNSNSNSTNSGNQEIPSITLADATAKVADVGPAGIEPATKRL